MNENLSLQIIFVSNQLLINHHKKLTELTEKGTLCFPQELNVDHFQYSSKKYSLMNECRLLDQKYNNFQYLILTLLMLCVLI